MPDPYRQAIRGEQVSFSTLAYNQMLAAAQAKRRATARFGDLSSTLSSTIVYIRNDLTTAIPIASILGLAGPLFKPSDSLPAFLREIIFATTSPPSGWPFVVTLQPLEPQQVGKAVISGAVAVQVNLTNSHHTTAVAAGLTGNLTSSIRGVPMLWNESQESGGPISGVMWSIIALGSLYLTDAIGKASGNITPRSGTSYGGGSVDIYSGAGGVETGPIETVTVSNAAQDTSSPGISIASGKYCAVSWDFEGRAWVAPLEC